MLHLIFQSPIQAAVLQRIAPGDVVVFLENAVLGILRHSAISDVLSRQLGNRRLCVLADDLAVRGISPAELSPGLETIDYAELVELTTLHPVIQSWT